MRFSSSLDPLRPLLPARTMSWWEQPRTPSLKSCPQRRACPPSTASWRYGLHGLRCVMHGRSTAQAACGRSVRSKVSTLRTQATQVRGEQNEQVEAGPSGWHGSGMQPHTFEELLDATQARLPSDSLPYGQLHATLQQRLLSVPDGSGCGCLTRQARRSCGRRCSSGMQRSWVACGAQSLQPI